MPSTSSVPRAPSLSITRKEDPSPAETEQQNYIILRECLSGPIIRKLAPSPASSSGGAGVGRNKARRRTSKPTNKQPSKNKNGAPGKNSSGNEGSIRDESEVEAEDKGPERMARGDVQTTDEDVNGNATVVEDLVEFVDYLTTELFSSLPPELRTLDYGSHASSASLQERYTPPLDASSVSGLVGLVPNTIPDSLLSYRLLPTQEHVPIFLSAVLNDYVSQAITPPPSIALAASSSSSSSSSAVKAKAQLEALRPSACELCGRDWIPLTYHHLIPRSTHDKVRKRGWHPDWRLNAVAWLCRACHDFVHGLASNEELAREWWSLERLRSREDTKVWVEWVGRVRWKKR